MPFASFVQRTLQYSLRLVLQYRLMCNPRKPSFAPSSSITALFSLCSVLSALRRVLALEHVVRSLSLSLGPRRSRPSPVVLDHVLAVSRTTLDLVAVLADSVYLGHRLGVVPRRVVSHRAGRTVDRVSDVATLASVAIALYDVARQANRVRVKADERRSCAQRLERELEDERVFRPSRADERGGGEGGGGGDVRDRAEVEDERRLRDKIRNERGKLRRAREQLGSLRWERWRLSAEGVFALYDVLDVEFARELTKSVTGAAASLIEAGQAWAEYAA